MAAPNCAAAKSGALLVCLLLLQPADFFAFKNKSAARSGDADLSPRMATDALSPPGRWSIRFAAFAGVGAAIVFVKTQISSEFHPMFDGMSMASASIPINVHKFLKWREQQGRQELRKTVQTPKEDAPKAEPLVYDERTRQNVQKRLTSQGATVEQIGYVLAISDAVGRRVPLQKAVALAKVPKRLLSWVMEQLTFKLYPILGPFLSQANALQHVHGMEVRLDKAGRIQAIPHLIHRFSNNRLVRIEWVALDRVFRLSRPVDLDLKFVDENVRILPIDAKNRLYIGTTQAAHGFSSGADVMHIDRGQGYLELWPVSRFKEVQPDFVQRIGGIPNLAAMVTPAPGRTMVGTFPGTLTEGVSVVLPREIRRRFDGSEAMLYADGDGNIRVFPAVYWDRVVRFNAPKGDAPLIEDYQRVVGARVMPFQINKSDHLVIPSKLLELLGMDGIKNYWIIGHGSYFEIRLDPKAQRRTEHVEAIPPPNTHSGIVRGITAKWGIYLSTELLDRMLPRYLLAQVEPEQGVRLILKPQNWLKRVQRTYRRGKRSPHVLADVFWIPVVDNHLISLNEWIRNHAGLSWGTHVTLYLEKDHVFISPIVDPGGRARYKLSRAA